MHPGPHRIHRGGYSVSHPWSFTWSARWFGSSDYSVGETENQNHLVSQVNDQVDSRRAPGLPGRSVLQIFFNLICKIVTKKPLAAPGRHFAWQPGFRATI